MRSDDFDGFCEVWAGAWEVVGRNVTPGALMLAFRALERYGLARVEAAVLGHMAQSRTPPTPADILDRLASSDGRPGSEEAWAVVAGLLADTEERLTVVLTDEMRVAWGAARDAYGLRRDAVGARMAFREVYEREVSAARGGGIPPRWSPIVGRDREARERPLNEAVALGRLAPEIVREHLPGPAATLADAVALLEQHGSAPRANFAGDGAPLPGLSPEFRAAATLRALSQRLKAGRAPDPEEEARHEAERERRRRVCETIVERLTREAEAEPSPRAAGNGAG